MAEPEDRAHAVSEAFSLAGAVADSNSRASLLTELLPHLDGLSPSRLDSIWSDSLPLLAKRTREDLVTDLRMLLPVIHTLGGTAAVAAVCAAIQDVGRWWP